MSSTPHLPPPSSPPSSPELEDDDYLALNAAEHGAESYQLRDLGKSLRKSRILRDVEATMEEEGDRGGEDEAFLGSGQRRRRKDSYTLYTPDEGKEVLKRLDRRVVGFMFVLYLLSFLDRSNIGNAAIAGLQQDLRLSSSQYEWLLTAFYISYIVFEWMTLLYRVFPAHIYISLCVLSWGLVASFQAIAWAFTPLLILRFLLGISEAAFSPGVPFYLSFFYRRDELAYRTGLFVSAAPLATSFSSSLAWLITKFAENGPISPWRLLFLIEGFPSVLVAFIAWECVPDGPDTAKFLTKRQREVAVLRLRDEREDADEEIAELEEKYAGGATGKGLNWREIVVALVDPKCYLTALMFFSCNVAFSSLPVFLPRIIKGMGHTSLAAQALSAPPYLLSFFFVILTAHLSDTHRLRSPYIILHSLLAALGYAVIALAGHLGFPTIIRYIAVYPACIGFFSSITLIITWSLNNQRGASAKGAGLVILNLIGQCGPLLGTRLYPESDAPLYVRGMTICAGFMVAVGVLAGGLAAVLKRRNEHVVKGWKGKGGEGGERRPWKYIL